MKYSLIIVAYKAADALGRCLASLEKNPPEDSQHEAEIIVVDNSPEAVDIPNRLLHSLLLKYVRVIIVRDGINRGFAEGCNEGVRHSHGKNLCFINPDTQVFQGWAEGLIQFLERSYAEGDGAEITDPPTAPKMKRIGAVGPISNFVAGLQHLTLHMNVAETWEKTAALARRGLRGRGVDTKLLIGFFFMVPRVVWDEVGGLDPVFFLGCDDLDFSLRLRDAGYEMVIASEVFVFHEGHVSFAAMGAAESIALNKQAEKALLKKLQAKYGEKLPTSTELWGCEILPTDTSERMSLSICMIVRNEVANLSHLLPQLGFADEIVIVNTAPEGGSVLNPNFEYDPPTMTPPPIKIFDLPWTDDFSTARNFALSKCSKQWVFWLDADDRIPLDSAKLIRAALDFPGPLTARRECHFALRLRDHLPNGRLGFCDQPRIFPNIPGMYWEGRIHENYMVRADTLGLKLVTTGIPLDHHGYEDADRLAAKHERNLRILDVDIDSPLKFYQIGKSEMGLKRFEAARGAFRTCMNRKWEADLAGDLVAQLRYMIALTYYQEFGAVEAMDEHLEDNPKPDAIFLRAERLFFQGKIDQAEPLYEQYANFGDIMDYYGTDRDSFQPAAVARLEQTEKLRSMVAG
jgi:GT2 family glycosyltransferase